MLISTTPYIEGKPAKTTIGLVSSEVIVGANFIKDISASITDLFGGRSNAYEGALQKGKEEALQELTTKAEAMGANAIIGVDMQFEAIGKGSMFLINVNGTAVKL